MDASSDDDAPIEQKPKRSTRKRPSARESFGEGEDDSVNGLALLKRLKKEIFGDFDESEEQMSTNESTSQNDDTLDEDSLNANFNSANADETMDGEHEDEQTEEASEDTAWQSEVRTLIQEGDATFDDFSSANAPTTLRWVVKHGIRLALMCTECGIIEQDDQSAKIEEHGLSCREEDQPSGDVCSQIVPRNLPRPEYKSAAQMMIRKGLDTGRLKLGDISDEMRLWPLKYAIDARSSKRGGICVICGDVFTSRNASDWTHECWLDESEELGFPLNEIDAEDSPYADSMGEDDEPIEDPLQNDPEWNPLAQKRSGSRRKTNSSEASTSLEAMKSLSEFRVHGREWAYSIRDRITRGELKEKVMVDDSDYSIRYLTDKSGVVVATICASCMRIFSPSINASNRNRHIEVCAQARGMAFPLKQEPADEPSRALEERRKQKEKSQNPAPLNLNKLDANLIMYRPSHYSKPIPLNARNMVTKTRESARLMKLENPCYNINLESIIVRTMTTDLLPTDVFYSNGMKTFFNKLLRVGYELGQQPGTILPTFDEILPAREVTDTNLMNYLNREKSKDVLAQVADFIKQNGGTLVVESVAIRDTPLPKRLDDRVALSFHAVDEWTPKRFTCDLAPASSTNALKCSIKQLFIETGLKSTMCNVLASREFHELLQWDKFELKAVCFGDTLSEIVERRIFNEATLERKEEECEKVAKLETILAKLPKCIEFLAKRCPSSSETRATLNTEFEGRWFRLASLAEQFLLLLRQHSAAILELLAQMPNSDEREMLKDLLQNDTDSTSELLQAYRRFAHLFATALEPCTMPRQATAHLVLLKFHSLKDLLSGQPRNDDEVTSLFEVLCKRAAGVMSSLGEEVITKCHQFATLLAPGHRDLMKTHYEEERILDLENSLIDLAKRSTAAQLSTNGTSSEKDAIEAELERYFEATAEPRVDPLEWWCRNEAAFSLLAPLAKRVLSTPATSMPAQTTLPAHLVGVELSDSVRSKVLHNWVAASDFCAAKKSSNKSGSG